MNDRESKNQTSDSKKKSKREHDAITFQGGKYEASGAISVPGTDGILIVDDNNPSAVLWVRLDKSGKQIGSVQAVSLGTGIEDPEGITSDGAYYYIVGSQSKSVASGQPGIVRFAFDPRSQRVSDVAVALGLREFLFEKVPELRTAGAGEGGGLDIEGIGFDPQRRQLLLGLRSPESGGQALVIPIKLRDSQGPFSTSNFEIGPSGVIRLPLGGQGIRDIQFDPRLNAFLIVSGAPRELKKTDFGIWEWDATNWSAQLRNRVIVDKDLQPEGITPANIGGGAFIFVACDQSKYLTLEY
ncbi:MAG TPA: DUF3616 domain-containing protein [Blastocatellia bacterium]|nr:DUF3616 domain-containing protein [Blastocatellia bacterium]